MVENVDRFKQPKFFLGTFCSLLAPSNAGKSTFLTNMLLEREYHFEPGVDHLIYIYSREDENIKKLKDEYPDGEFLKEIPLDLPSHFIKNKSICVIDDKEVEIQNSKALIQMINSLSNVLAHHDNICVFVTYQSYDSLYKRNALHSSILNSSHYVFFRNPSNITSLKFFMNKYELNLKRKQTLWDIYKNVTQKNLFDYLVVCVSPQIKRATCFSRILFNDERNMLSFHDSSSEDESDDE